MPKKKIFIKKMNFLLEAFRNELSGDEFYTKYGDIQKELSNYDFSNMIVYCNCDKPDSSNFVKYFKNNFTALGIRKLMATFNGTKPFLYEFDGISEKNTSIASGRFQDNIDLVKQCDIVVTNPPFSNGQALEMINLLIPSGKKFIIVAPFSLCGRKIIIDYIKEGLLFIGNNNIRRFDAEDGKTISSPTCWWTNIPVNHEPILLTAKYNKQNYPMYDNFNAIECSNYKLIPSDYKGNIGVPITFLSKFNQKQFEILGILYHPTIKGKNIMSRIIIKLKTHI